MPRYGKAAGKSVKSAMRRKKKGTLRSGKGGKGGRVNTRKQAIAIGLSKARRAGIKLPVPEKGSVPEKTRTQALRDSAKGQSGPTQNESAKKVSPKRSRAATLALQREGRGAATHEALSRQAHSSARRRAARQG